MASLSKVRARLTVNVEPEDAVDGMLLEAFVPDGRIVVEVTEVELVVVDGTVVEVVDVVVGAVEVVDKIVDVVIEVVEVVVDMTEIVCRPLMFAVVLTGAPASLMFPSKVYVPDGVFDGIVRL